MLYCNKNLLEGGGEMDCFGLNLPRQQVYRIVLQSEPVSGEICGFSEGLQADWAYNNGVLTVCGREIPALPHLFEGFSFLQEIVGLENMKPAGESLSHLFCGCTMLKKIDLSSWDLSGVKDCTAMFRDCSLLEEVKLHINGAENLSELFSGCLSLKEIDVSDWNVSEVKNFSRLFLDCGKLENLDVSGWRLSSAEDCGSMFSCCKSLKKLDVSRWSPKKLRDCSRMFNRCENLQNLGIGGWKQNKKLRDCTKMFHRCRQLKKLDLRRFVWENVRCDGMFLGCSAEILLNDEDFSTLKEGNSWFSDPRDKRRLAFVGRILLCDREESAKGWPADLRNSGYLLACVEQDTLKLCGPAKIFANPKSRFAFTIHGDRGGPSYLREIEGLERLDTSKVVDFQEMFADNVSLTRLDVGHFDTKNACSLAGMFRRCEQLRAVDVSGWDTANCESFLQLFDGCRWLKSVDVSRWNTANVRDYRGMFHGCQLLQTPDLSGWSRHPKALCQLMFDGCPRVKTDDWK